MDSTTALPYGSPFPDSDPPMSNTSSSPSILALSNPPPRSVWNTSTSVRGKSSVANAPNTRLASRARPAEWPVMPLFARSMSRHTYAHAHVRQVTGQVGARLAAIELAAEDVREPGLVGPRPVRFGPSARARARMPRSRMMLPTRLPDAVTPLRSSAALIFPAPQRSWLSRRTARTSPAIGSTRSASGCPVIQ